MRTSGSRSLCGECVAFRVVGRHRYGTRAFVGLAGVHSVTAAADLAKLREQLVDVGDRFGVRLSSRPPTGLRNSSSSRLDSNTFQPAFA
jgi:hypothetical protein